MWRGKSRVIQCWHFLVEEFLGNLAFSREPSAGWLPRVCRNSCPIIHSAVRTLMVCPDSSSCGHMRWPSTRSTGPVGDTWPGGLPVPQPQAAYPQPRSPESQPPEQGFSARGRLAPGDRGRVLRHCWWSHPMSRGQVAADHHIMHRAVHPAKCLVPKVSEAATGEPAPVPSPNSCRWGGNGAWGVTGCRLHTQDWDSTGQSTCFLPVKP